jgi:thiamine biosynthesis protein ThiS|tara:strand:- start:328 stop:546 length:219 start_codon:yes stop_codon:yes gene_type:complete
LSSTERIQVRLNGKDRDITFGHTVQSLLEAIEINPLAVVVELNKQILDRDRYSDFDIREGDMIEVVHFVGGG